MPSPLPTVAATPIPFGQFLEQLYLSQYGSGVPSALRQQTESLPEFVRTRPVHVADTLSFEEALQRVKVQRDGNSSTPAEASIGSQYEPVIGALHIDSLEKHLLFPSDEQAKQELAQCLAQDPQLLNTIAARFDVKTSPSAEATLNKKPSNSAPTSKKVKAAKSPSTTSTSSTQRTSKSPTTKKPTLSPATAALVRDPFNLVVNPLPTPAKTPSTSSRAARTTSKRGDRLIKATTPTAASVNKKRQESPSTTVSNTSPTSSTNATVAVRSKLKPEVSSIPPASQLRIATTTATIPSSTITKVPLTIDEQLNNVTSPWTDSVRDEIAGELDPEKDYIMLVPQSVLDSRAKSIGDKMRADAQSMIARKLIIESPLGHVPEGALTSVCGQAQYQFKLSRDNEDGYLGTVNGYPLSRFEDMDGFVGEHQVNALVVDDRGLSPFHPK